MNDILKVFLSLSLSGSLLILILFLSKHFLENKVSRQWQYYIWLIVIARLLFPFAPEINLMKSIFQTINHTVIQVEQPQQVNLYNFQSIENTPNLSIEQNKQRELKQPIQEIINLFINNIWLAWLIIALILLIQKITVYKSFVHYVKSGQTPVTDIKLLDQLSIIVSQVGIKKPVELCINPLVSSPLLIGFFRPYIVLPSTDISERDFHYTVLHELIHYQRRDMFYKWLVQLTVCLHWFNPLVYLMSREINRACEFSCDEVIIAKLDLRSIQDYGKTLLDAMMKSGNYKESLASVTLSENKKMLKERLGAIMSFKKKSQIVVGATCILTVIFICGASYTGAYATKNISSTNNKHNEQITKDYSQIVNKPGTELHMIDRWSGSANEVNRQDGIVEVNLTNFIGSRNNYEFETQDSTATLHLKSSLSGNYEILFMAEGSKTILEAIPSFTGSKEIILTGLPKGTICLSIYAMNASGKLEIEKVSTQDIITPTNSYDTTLPKTIQSDISEIDNLYNSYQRGYYQGSYIFELRWNLDEKSYNSYPDKVELTLSDLTNITVSFDKSYKNEIHNQEVLTDLKELIERLKIYSTIPLNNPLVISIEYIGDNELVKLAEEYYEDGKLTKFSAIFSSLDKVIQEEYFTKMIDDDKLTFFSSCAEYMDTDMVEYCTEKTYQEDKLTFFSNVAPYLSNSQRQAWVARASRDDRNTFLSILTDESHWPWNYKYKKYDNFEPSDTGFLK